MPPPKRVPRKAVVVSKERLTPHMLRIVFGGEGLADLPVGDFTDHYVKLVFPEPGADRPRVRTYTVREWDPESGQLTIDFVVHGDTGIAGPWAEAAQPGDTLNLLGPGGGYAPDPDADWHLLAGDASVIPAIAASLGRIAAGARVHVLIEIDGPEEEQPLTTAGDLHLQWVHRTAAPGEQPDLLVDAIRALEFPDGRCDAFVHGEASSVRAVRRHLIAELGYDKDAVSATGYWKLHLTDEGWREDKAEWKRLAEADVA
jgi:NADPH-dependent ferric siderophore reductase